MVNDLHQEGLEEGGEAAGHEDIAGAPDALVQRQAVGEQIAANDTNRAHDEEGDDLVADGLFLTDEPSAVEAQQGVGDGRDGAHETLGIDGTLMVEVVVAEEVQVDLRQHVHAGILDIAVAEDEDGGIDCQQTDDYGHGISMVAEEGEERHDAITERDALHDRPDAEMAETEEVALDGVVEPVDEESDDKEQYGALDDAADDLRRGFELGLHQGEVTRDTHDEEEEGEDEVAGGHAVPLRVAEHLERLAPAVVHQYHACDGNAAENIET